MEIYRSMPQGTHYHVDAIYLLPQLGIKRDERVRYTMVEGYNSKVGPPYAKTEQFS